MPIDWNKGLSSADASFLEVSDEEAKLSFEWIGNHNVYLLPSKETFDSCDFTDAILIGDASPTFYTVATFPNYFACDIDNHCLWDKN